MTGQIVVSRRDGVLTAPNGVKWRVVRGKTLADADHPAVAANPRDWAPIEITLTVDQSGPDVGSSDRDATLDELRSALEDARGEQAELEETLSQRDAELSRLAEGLAAAGVALPDDRQPGWLCDLALEAVETGLNALKEQAAFKPGVVAPPKSRRRPTPPVVTKSADGVL
jgi:hypothetical protein